MGSPSLEQLCLPSVFSDLTTMRALILTLTLILLSLLLSVQAKRSSLYEDKPFDKNNPRMSTENCNIRGQEDDLSSLSAGCPTGWKSMFNSCFQWFYTAIKTWQDAENHCQQFGGHLASLSEVENELIGKTILGTVWIGGKKVGSQWTWSDGTPWSLGNVWSVGGGECATTFAGSASGFDCNQERFYICKIA